VTEKHKPNPRVPLLYFMHSQYFLRFLDKIGFNNSFFNASEVNKRVETFQKTDVNVMNIRD
jgi:hypothetical protein